MKKCLLSRKSPPYGPGKLPITDRIVIADDVTFVTWFDRNTLKGMIGEGFPKDPWGSKVFVFGKVLYRDLLNPSLHSIHETSWLSLYQLTEEGDAIYAIEGFGFVGGYERYT